MSAQQHPRPLPESRESAAAPSPMPSPAPLRPEPVEEPAPPPSKAPGGLAALLLLLLGAGAGWWLHNQTDGSASLSTSGGGPGAFVRTTTVTTGPLEETIRLSGSIAAQTFATIRAPQIRRRSGGGSSSGAGIVSTSGGGGGGTGGGGGGSSSSGSLTIIELVSPGAKVTKGQIVAEFDRQSQQQAIDDQQADVVQAIAIIDRTKAELMVELETKRQEMVTAKAEYEKALLDERTAEVRTEIEAELLRNLRQQAEAAYKQLEKEVALMSEAHAATIRQAEIDKEQEEIDLRRAEHNAERLVVRTPIAGIAVMQTVFRGGSFAQIALGDEVYPGSYFLQVVDPTSMVLEAKVNQADSQRIRIGSRADVHLDAYPDRVWPGRVKSIAAMTGSGGGDGRSRSGSGDYVREITVTIEILESSEEIIPDLSASADIYLHRYDDVVIAPREAVERDADGWFVRVRAAARNAFERRPVELGSYTDTHVAVSSGLKAGEVVALEPPPTSK